MASKGGIASLAEGRTDVYSVDPRKLHVKEGWNSRDFSDPSNITHIDDLAQSIAVKGVLQPLTVYFEDGKAYISDGECRYRAALRAIEHYKSELKTVPVRSEERYANEPERLLNQFIRNSGKPFSAIELSNHFKRLLGLGWQAKDIAGKAGMTQARVSQILGLQTLPEPVKHMIVQGQVAPSTAVALVKEVGATEAEKQLAQGWATAQAEGKDKVLPRHIEPVSTPGQAWGNAPSQSLKVLVRDAFNESTISEPVDGIVTIRMSEEDYDRINAMLD